MSEQDIPIESHMEVVIGMTDEDEEANKRQKDTMKKRVLRQDESFRKKEAEKARQRMSQKRNDPAYREIERQRDRQRRALARQTNSEGRARERERDKIHKREQRLMNGRTMYPVKIVSVPMSLRRVTVFQQVGSSDVRNHFETDVHSRDHLEINSLMRSPDKQRRVQGNLSTEKQEHGSCVKLSDPQNNTQGKLLMGLLDQFEEKSEKGKNTSQKTFENQKSTLQETLSERIGEDILGSCLRPNETRQILSGSQTLTGDVKHLAKNVESEDIVVSEDVAIESEVVNMVDETHCKRSYGESVQSSMVTEVQDKRYNDT